MITFNTFKKRSMRSKLRIVSMLLMMLCITSFILAEYSKDNIAYANTYINTATSVEYATNIEDIIVTPGETKHVKLPVKAVGYIINNPKIIVDTDNMPYVISNIKVTDGTSESIYIATSGSSYIEFDLRLKETASIGRYKINISAEFQGMDGNTFENVIVKKDFPTITAVVETEKEPAQLTIDNITLPSAIKGNQTELSFIIKNEGEISTRNTYYSIDGYEAAGIIPAYSKLTQEAGTDGRIEGNGFVHVKLPVDVDNKAIAGKKTLTVNFTYKDVDGTPYQDSVKIYVNVEENENAPKIEIESVKFASELKAGDKFNLVVTLRNAGETDASSIKLNLDGLGVSSFIQNYTTPEIQGGEIASKGKLDVKVPLIVSKEATPGLKKIDIRVDYQDSGKVSYATTTTAYLDVSAADGVTADGKPNIVINNVSQSPNVPHAGARVDISFDIENKSKIDISEMKISVTNLSSTNFSPVNLEPYQYIDKIAGGKKARVTIPLNISNMIQEGMSNIEVKLDYKDATGGESIETTTLYVLDIENNVGASKPKLLISNFSTDVEDLKAGSVFTFKYELKNTHANINANNIKITVSQQENVFSVTKGSNTSYVNRIPAGEVVENTIELKVKSDAVTKAYPIDIVIEYEYDGAEINPTTGQVGETVKETINLLAIENTRPELDGINVNYGEMPTINQATPLSFVFYNMGKSPLNNVSALVEGDYTLSTGSKFFIGNVQPGYSEYAEMEVIPNVEGQAKGAIVISFEDSNGEEVTIREEFESMVQGEFIPDFNDNMGGGFDVPVVVESKKEIVAPWIFILIQVAILIIFIPVTRKVVLSLYRKKLKKREESEMI